MTVEGFVRMSGALMGIARESFGTGARSGAPVPVLSSVPGGPVAGSGSAAAAFEAESDVVGGHLAGLGEQDRVGDKLLDDAVAASVAGRERMDAVIASAAVDVDALAPVTDTPQGRRALVDALTRRLDETKDVLDDGAADASTRAAATSVSAAGYDGLGRLPAGGLAPSAPVGMPAAAPMPTMPQLPMMPLSGLGQLATVLGQGPFGAVAAAGADAPGRSGGDRVSPASAIPVREVRFDREGFPRGREAYRGYIAKALDVLGIQDPAARGNWTRGLMVGLGRESGFDPAAVNLYDSNAHGPRMSDGAPANSSRGGMQTIPATFAANHQPGTSTNIYDPVANLCAGMNYLMRRYHVARDGSNLSAVSQFNPLHHGQGY